MNYNIPALWYPQGAGGMWLNYLIWCHNNQTTIPDELLHFEFSRLQEIMPSYRPYVHFEKHANDFSPCRLRLGGAYWFNFYVNFCTKKPNENRYCAVDMLKYIQQNINFNLDWKLIFTDPESFLFQLTEGLTVKIDYNKYTEIAIEQYRKSCPGVDLNSEEFRESVLYQDWETVVQQHLGMNKDQVLDFTRTIYIDI